MPCYHITSISNVTIYIVITIIIITSAITVYS